MKVLNNKLVKLSLIFEVLKNYKYVICIDCLGVNTFAILQNFFNGGNKYVSKKYFQYFLLLRGVKIEKGLLSNFIFYTNSIFDADRLISVCNGKDLWFISFIDLSCRISFGSSWFFLKKYVYKKFYSLICNMVFFFFFKWIFLLLNLV